MMNQNLIMQNVTNYLDPANMATNLESAMKIAEEEDLWIGTV